MDPTLVRTVFASILSDIEQQFSNLLVNPDPTSRALLGEILLTERIPNARVICRKLEDQEYDVSFELARLNQLELHVQEELAEDIDNIDWEKRRNRTGQEVNLFMSTHRKSS